MTPTASILDKVFLATTPDIPVYALSAKDINAIRLNAILRKQLIILGVHDLQVGAERLDARLCVVRQVLGRLVPVHRVRELLEISLDTHRSKRYQ